jgi:hypothetical protein
MMLSRISVFGERYESGIMAQNSQGGTRCPQRVAMETARPRAVGRRREGAPAPTSSLEKPIHHDALAHFGFWRAAGELDH